MPKDLSKLPARELAALSGQDDEDMVEEQWWALDSIEDSEEVEVKSA